LGNPDPPRENATLKADSPPDRNEDAMHRIPTSLILATGAILLSACASSPKLDVRHYDLLIRNGLVHDGNGNPPREVDVGVDADRIVALLPRGSQATATNLIDAKGQAVAPGFINVLSWATESLIADGRGISDTKQGVTLEVFGEGWSMGPYNEAMKTVESKRQGDIRYTIEWTTLGEYLEFLQARGVTPNIASFV
jgi:N-acyl-D-amino-acid deacylase